MGDFKLAKDAFNKLKVDLQSAVFAEEILDKNSLSNLKNQSIIETNNFLKMYIC